MRCPKCPGSLETAPWEDVVLDRCSLCFGLWFDREELVRFNVFDPDFPLLSPIMGPAHSTRLHCPRCAGILDEIRYGTHMSLEFDRCGKCGGVWFDEDEIERVRRALREDRPARGRNPESIRETARREEALIDLRESELAHRESRAALSRGHWLFMFLTGLPREVYHPVHHFPAMTTGLILANILIFLAESVFAGSEGQTAQLFATFGFIPERVRHIEQPWSVLTSMFLHAGPVHLIGNMYFLYTFGDNVEDFLRPLRFLSLFLLSGVAAEAVQFAADIRSDIPMVGASGAIAGILGAYWILFSRRKIHLLILVWPVKLRAGWYLAFWFGLQILSAWQQAGQQVGTAWFAHIGGFVAGWACGKYMKLTAGG